MAEKTVVSALRALLHLLLLLSDGASQVIRTQRTVAAEVGGSARFYCLLLQPKDVRQVTWQKVSPGRQRNLASSTKFFGQTVNPAFMHKVAIEDASLQNSSIVLRRVAREDEGCYRCLVNTYPEGAFMSRTCLLLCELQEPLLLVRPLNSSQEALVSCRATGRPAPNVTLAVRPPDLRLTNHSHVSVPNHNGTFTVTVTALLSGSRGHGGAQVACVASGPSGQQLEVLVTLPQVQHTSAEDFLLLVELAAAMAVCCIVAVVALVAFLKHKKKNKDFEMAPTTPLTVKPEPKGLDHSSRMCPGIKDSTRKRIPGNQREKKGSKRVKQKLCFS